MSLRLGSARTWRIALGLLTLLSYAAAIPLTVVSHQLGDGVIAAVIGVPRATCVAIGAALSAHPVRVDSTAGLTAIDNPAGWFNAVQGPSAVATVVLTLALITRQALSWRRATGERRQQLKWLASGAAVTIVCLPLATAFSTPGRATTLLGVIGSLAWFGVAALPVSIGVAILKYRLYEIDRILPAGLSEIGLSPAGGRRHARFFVLGGAPLGERPLMWWNFVARSSEEITQAREDWVAGRFGDVHGYPGEPLAAPALPAVPLKPR